MEQPINSRKEKLYEIIFKSDTPAGKAFDVVLIIMIVFSSLVVLVDSISSIHEGYGPFLYAMEWFFTIIFTIEYLLRIYCVESKLRYIGSFFGVIDLLTILPALISIIFPSAQFLMVIRILRLLRLFRIFKMVRYIQESKILKKALLASRPKITIFIFTILFVVTHCRCCHVHRGRGIQRIQQYSRIHVLGHYYRNHGRFWRYHPPDRCRKIYRQFSNDHCLRHPGGSYRYFQL